MKNNFIIGLILAQIYEQYQIQSSNVIKRSTPYLLFCRVLLCCAVQGRAAPQLHRPCHFLLFCLFAEKCDPLLPSVFHQFRRLCYSPLTAEIPVFTYYSNFCSVGRCVLGRARVYIRVCASEVATGWVPVAHGRSRRSVVLMTVSVITAILSISTGGCPSGRRNFPAMLGGRVAAQHRVQALA